MSSASASRTRFARGGGLLALLLAGTLLGGCGGEAGTPAQKIEARLKALASAVEQGAVREAGEHLHPDYRDRRHASRRAALGSLALYLRRHDNIHLLTLVRSVRVADDGQGARAEVLVGMAGVPVESVDALVSVKADLYRFDVDLVRDGETWLVSSSDWRRADLSLLSVR